MPRTPFARVACCLQKRGGFTLIELLIVISIIAILASIVIYAVNPSKQLGTSRDLERRQEIKAIMEAFWQYSIDNNGVFQPSSIDGVALDANCQISATPRKLCKETTPHGTSSGQCGNASVACAWTRHLSGTYITSIPSDPNDNESNAAEQAMLDYRISQPTVGRLTIDAPSSEQVGTISISR